MKIIVVGNNYPPLSGNGRPGWYIIADSAMTNTGKPLYLPENQGVVTVSLTIAVRISRLGKHIGRKFAPRYYSEYAAALNFRKPDYAAALRAEGEPEDASRNFDRALFVGEFSTFDDFSPLKLRVNGEERAEFNPDLLQQPIDGIIESVSADNTLKIGDLLIPGLSGEIRLKEGDLLEVIERGERAFHVKVR